ncbi:MAG: nucleoside-diphosphate sugar epimerase [Flavobacteriaceae bacterium]|nr:nucleoside-diphosphate sugar epimerase [Flavobacteriaceae bacterium]|tara:strand:+ start:25764 stop:26720 length:957 start_codon:yes stop_codon:yes gene_type:complete
MIVVTGGAGFVGSNMVKFLNSKNHNDIIIVDSLKTRNLYKNLKGLKYIDFINYKNGIDFIKSALKKYSEISLVIHIGANSDVLEKDCDVMIDLNFDHSKFWFNYCAENDIQFIYSSSSAIYGNSDSFIINEDNDDPHNEYGISKLIFDKYVNFNIKNLKNRVIGFRFFNIFGMGEFHKEKNASLPFRFFNFILNDGLIELFKDEILRDYVYVNDVCEIIYYAWNNKVESGIYNLGGNNPISHKKLAQIVIDTMKENNIINSSKNNYIKEINIPADLKNHFQFYTHAEKMPQWISSLTKSNELKIKKYILDLIHHYSIK